MNDSIRMHSKDNFIIAIGSSTGGTTVIQDILKALPEDSPPIIIVQHMPISFTSFFADRLNAVCKISVKEAKNGDTLTSGVALIAPTNNLHTKVVFTGGKFRVQLVEGEKVNGFMPSVDVLFNSVSQNATSNAIGILLTGMGNDGANGLLSLKRAGAYTIGQNEASCVVYGMPNEAKKLGGVVVEAAPSEIPALVKKYLNKFK